MSNIQKYTPKQLFNQDTVKRKFEQILGEKAQGFVASVLQCVANNDMLSNASSDSVYNAAMTAATLDLPINPNLGFAYIIPYNLRNQGAIAQFQMGYKGYIQLAQRTGQYRTISATPIYEGQLISENPLTGFEFDFRTKASNKVIGYAAYIELVNGFQKTLYMSMADMEAHAKKYSKSYNSKNSIWKEDFDAMAQKTVLKLLISKYGPMSTEMQNAVLADQAHIKDPNNLELEYPDNPNGQPPQQQAEGRKAIDTSDAENAQVIDGEQTMAEYDKNTDHAFKN